MGKDDNATQSRCRPTSRSAPSRSLRRRRSRTAQSHNGFVYELATPSDTMLSDDTGARPDSASRRLAPSSTPIAHHKLYSSVDDLLVGDGIIIGVEWRSMTRIEVMALWITSEGGIPTMAFGTTNVCKINQCLLLD